MVATPVGRRLATAVALVAVAALAGLVLWWPRGDQALDREALGFADRVAATVTESSTGPCSFDPTTRCHTFSFRVDGAGDGDGGAGGGGGPRGVETRVGNRAAGAP